MTALLLKYAPYLAAVLVVFGAGSWTGYKGAQPAYNRLQGQFSDYKAQVAADELAAQKAATAALQAQIAQRNEVESNNAKVIADLQSKADSAAADRDFARRLLAAAQARPAPNSDPATKTQGGSTADGSPDASGNRSLVADLGAAAGECRDAIERFSALQAELRPQL